MSGTAPVAVSSRDNPLVKDLRRLAQDSTAYRKQGRVWLEGDHLCRAALARGLGPAIAVFAELSGLESPADLGFVLELPSATAPRAGLSAVVLDRLQDAGNVGSILRSAAAFGFGQVVALKGTAALWSPKVLRAGMGAHFALSLVESAAPEDLAALGLPLLVTSSHRGELLHRAALPWPCAWVMGHEGQGVSAALEAQATHHIRIAQPGGEESLNVGAAAAICLHASAAARA